MEEDILNANSDNTINNLQPHTNEFTNDMAIRWSDDDSIHSEVSTITQKILSYNKSFDEFRWESGILYQKVKDLLKNDDTEEKFLVWLDKGVRIHHRTAQRYMQYAREFSKTTALSLGYKRALELFAVPAEERNELLSQQLLRDGEYKFIKDMSLSEVKTVVDEYKKSKTVVDNTENDETSGVTPNNDSNINDNSNTTDTGTNDHDNVTNKDGNTENNGIGETVVQNSDVRLCFLDDFNNEYNKLLETLDRAFEIAMQITNADEVNICAVDLSDLPIKITERLQADRLYVLEMDIKCETYKRTKQPDYKNYFYIGYDIVEKTLNRMIELTDKMEGTESTNSIDELRYLLNQMLDVSSRIRQNSTALEQVKIREDKLFTN